MNMAEGNVEPTLSPVIKRLREKNIYRVVVVDDAYDPPTRSDLERNELADFWSDCDPESVDQQETLRRIIGFVPGSEDEINDASVAALYEHRDVLGPLQQAFDTHLRPPLELKHAVLNPFTHHLRDELGLEVQTHGTHSESNSGAVEVIFLDYYLGIPRDEEAVRAAQDALRRLLSIYQVGAEKPLIVLMSSHEDVKWLAEKFRAEMGIVGGMFYFVPKTDLTDYVKLVLNLEMLADALPAGHLIQKFIDAVEAKADSIKSEFLAGIKQLNLDDYVYIQRLSLQKEGHPLGDYLLWLYSAYFGHLLFEDALRSERQELDKLTFTEWIPSHSTPSRQLTKMYHAALFDTTVGPLGEHPRWSSTMAEQVKSDSHTAIPPDTVIIAPEQSVTVAQENSSASIPVVADQTHTYTGQIEPPIVVSETDGQGGIADSRQSTNGNEAKKDPSADKDVEVDARQLPYFNLGDVFLDSSSTKLLMVSNPACDLEFTPDDERLPDPYASIMFIPGVLENLNAALASEGLRTELFEYDGKSYRVQWQPKRVQAIAHKDAFKWLESQGFQMVARLRMPFCLEIQQHFAASLTRVGIPVPPPFCRPLQVTLYEKGLDAGYVAVPLIDLDAEAFVLQTRRDGEKCSLTAGLIRALQRHIDQLARADLQPIDKTVPKSNEVKQIERANKRIERAIQIKDDLLAWREIRQPFSLPAKGKRKIFQGVGVVVGHDVSVEGQWDGDSLLMVHISDPVQLRAVNVEENISVETNIAHKTDPTSLVKADTGTPLAPRPDVNLLLSKESLDQESKGDSSV